MTEAEWLACKNTQTMLASLHGKTSDRKMRLFAVACCRRILHLIKDQRNRSAIEIAEQFAEGIATESERRSAHDHAFAACSGFMPESARAALAVILPSIDAVMEYTATRARYAMAAEGCRTTVVAEESVQVALLRDVIGPLVFRPVIPDSAWVTPTVISLSQAVYADRAFDRVPILADALEDAGCTNQDILSHCRGAGPHALGCWVVDLLLGKE